MACTLKFDDLNNYYILPKFSTEDIANLKNWYDKAIKALLDVYEDTGDSKEELVEFLKTYTVKANGIENAEALETAWKNLEGELFNIKKDPTKEDHIKEDSKDPKNPKPLNPQGFNNKESDSLDLNTTIVDLDNTDDPALKEIADKIKSEANSNNSTLITSTAIITSSLDIINVFGGNSNLVTKFRKDFSQNLFKTTFFDTSYGKSRIIKTTEDLSNAIGDLKVGYFQNIVNYLYSKRILNTNTIELYTKKKFNLTDYLFVTSKFKSHIEEYSKLNDKLFTLNNNIFTTLSAENKSFYDAYSSYFYLTNFDNLVQILGDGIIYIHPALMGTLNDLDTPKYSQFKKNKIASTFYQSTAIATNIEHETSAITRTVIQNFKKFDFKTKKWRGQYVTLGEFNNAISKLYSMDIKNNYPYLNQAHIDPIKTYEKFFKEVVADSNFITSSLFSNSEKDILYSIYLNVFNTDETIAKDNDLVSLKSLLKDNDLSTANKLGFNYYHDILAYINKQSPQDYLVYTYDFNSGVYKLQTLSGLFRESSYKNQEYTIASHLRSLPSTSIFTSETFNFINRNSDNSINIDSIKLGDSEFKLSSSKATSILTIPTPDQIANFKSGNINELDKKVLKGCQYLKILEDLTRLPFISNGQLYEVLKSFFSTLSNDNTIIKNLNLLIKNSLIALDLNIKLKEKELTKGNLLDAEEVLNTLIGNYDLNEKNINNFVTSTTLYPMVIISKSFSDTSKTTRSDIFKRVIDALNIINNQNSPTVFKNGNGDNVPSIGLMNLVKTIPDFIELTKLKLEESRRTHPESSTLKNILEKNLFFTTNGTENNILKGTILKTEFTNSNGDTYQKQDFTIPEYTVSSIMLDYYKNLISNDSDRIYILPTVYADKAQQTLIGISKNAKINNKTLKEATVEDIIEEYHNQQKNYYLNLVSNLFNTYYRLIEYTRSDKFLYDVDMESNKEDLLKIRKIFENKEYNLLKSLELSDNTKNLFNTNLNKINKILNNYKSELDTIVDLFNKHNPKQRIDFIDETHYSAVFVNEGGKKPSKKYYFNPFLEYCFNTFVADISSFNKFYDRSLLNFIQDILRYDIKFDVTAFPELLNDKEIKNNWVDEDGYLKIIKLKNGITINYEKDIRELKIYDIKEINPIIKKFFALDGLFSTQFMQITGSTAFAHPSKLKTPKSKNWRDNYDESENFFIEDYAARLNAQYKRMVMMQGTIHNYFNGSLYGTTNKVNCAVVEDLKGYVYLPSGEDVDADALDGSMLTTGTQNVLENNAMFSSTSGTNRKNFGFDLDPTTGTPTLFKTATFAIDNSIMMMNSKAILLFKKMTDLEYNIDLSSIEGRNGLFNEVGDNLKSVIPNDIYYLDLESGIENDYKQVVNIEHIGDNKYKVTTVRVNLDGITGKVTPKGNEETRIEVINTNFKLWKVLGGETSVTLDTSNPVNCKFVLSEDSIYNTAKFMNYVRIPKCKEILGQDFNCEYETAEEVKKAVNEGRITQNEFYQPLKHSDIHYLMNKSGIKVGAKNVNKVDKRFNNIPFNYFTINTNYFGIQMDAEHDADNAEVTESTQIISTLACNGYSFEDAEQVYRAIAQFVDLTLKELLNGNDYSTVDQATLYKVLGKSFMKSLRDLRTEDSSLSSYLNRVNEVLNSNLEQEANKENYKLPFSSSQLNSKFITMLTSKMNMDTIKRKNAGTGAVMKPSYSIMQFYRFNNITFVNPINNQSVTLNGNYSEFDLRKIANKLGYTLNLETEETPIQQMFKDNREKLIYPITPATLNFGDVVINEKGNRETIDTYAKYKKYKYGYLNNNKELLIDRTTPTDLQQFKLDFEILTSVGDTEIVSLYDLDFVQELFKSTKAEEGQKPETTEEIKRKCGETLQQFLIELEDGVELNSFILEHLNPDLKQALEIEGPIKVVSIHKQPAEVILPRIYQTNFLLDNNTNLNDVLTQEEKFFYEKIQKHYKRAEKIINEDDVSFVLLSSTGEDVAGYLNKDLSNDRMFEELIVPTKTVDGIVYRTDDKGSRLYPLEGLKFYRKLGDLSNKVYLTIDTEKTNVNTIANILKDSNYLDYYLNFKNEELDNYLNLEEVKNNNLFKKLSEDYFDDAQGDLYAIGKLAASEYNRKIDKKINAKAKKIYASFLQALNCTVNRIPAQAFQSIMAMKCVGFTNSNTNEVYVGIIQTILQGSDYDIDKAYITMPWINEDGLYAKWSNAFDFKYLNESIKLPLPKENDEINNYYEYNIEKPIYENNLSGTLIQFGIDLNNINANNLSNNDKRQLFKFFVALLNKKVTFTFDSTDEELGLSWVLTYLGDLFDKHQSPLNDQDKESGLKNFIFNKIYTISNNLKNYIASYTPVNMDDPREAAKQSSISFYLNKITDFTPTTKYAGFFAQMAGKKGVGISAVGQKTFLALTQYFNTFNENTFNYDNDALNKVWNIAQEDGTIKSFMCPSLANINNPELYKLSKEILRSGALGIDENVVDVLLNNRMIDQSLVISAVISAATDNAKELILDKINANPEFMGTYIYLIMNNIPFSDIANLMKSDVVTDLKKLVNGNRLYNKNISMDSIINYITKSFPSIFNLSYEVVNKLKQFTDLSNPKYLTIKGVQELLEKIDSALNTKISFNSSRDDDFNDNNIKSLISKEQELTWEYRRYLKQLQTYAKFRLLYLKGKSMSESKQKIKKLDSDGINSLNLYNFINAYLDSKELQTLGGILGINGGAKTKYYDKYSFIQNIKSLYKNNRKSESPEEFDFHRFITEPEYAETIINGYNKRAFNVFKVIRTLPHYKSFLTAFDANETNTSNLSSKYYMLNTTAETLSNKLYGGEKLSETQIKAINDFIDEIYLRKFIESELSDFNFTINKGRSYFRNGKLYTTTDNININLKDFVFEDFIANFKFWMDNTVIPNLYSGYIERDNTNRFMFMDILGSNNFLRNLIKTQERSSVTGKLFDYYRSNINPMAMDSSELDNMRAEFNKVKNIIYKNHTIGDLFTLYDLVVNKEKQRQGSFIKILSDAEHSDKSILHRYYKFLGDVDYNKNVVEIDPVKNPELWEELVIRTAPLKGSREAGILASGKNEDNIFKKFDRKSGNYIYFKTKFAPNEYEKMVKMEDSIENTLDSRYYILNASSSKFSNDNNSELESNQNKVEDNPFKNFSRKTDDINIKISKSSIKEKMLELVKTQKIKLTFTCI